MGLREMIKKTRLGYGGEKPTYRADNTKLSPLHYTYSINGKPNLMLGDYIKPSSLSLGGATPKRYSDNLPQ
jgi:hypothetical protein